MFKVTIIGDSNGCGEWNLNWDKFIEKYGKYSRELFSGKDEYVIETPFGIDTYLNEIGYSCFNISFGNNTNIRSIIDLQQSLLLRLPRKNARFLNPDYIIWFLTEPLRDVRCLNYNLYEDDNYLNKVKNLIENSRSLYELNKELLSYSFEEAEKTYQITKIPFIIVEGLTETFDLEKKYNFCSFVIKNWIGNIAGSKPPIISSNECLDNVVDKLSNIIDDDVIENYKKWIELMKDENDFIDYFHPKREKHKQLSSEIDYIINKLLLKNKKII